MFNFLKRFKGNNRFADKNLDNNIILTYDVQLSLDTAQTGKNLNVCVIGGTGMGKIYNYVLPNILQANTSYVITDRDGYLLKKTGKFLKEQGYIIKVLNLNDTEHSNHYNPFDYVCDKNEICDEMSVTKYDDMELNLIGDRKTAIFINVSMSSISYNGLFDVLVTQIFSMLYDRAALFPNNQLPIPVRFMLDEFPNVYISDLEKHSAVCVHKNISVNIILQGIVQLKMIYSNWDVILNNCDSILFLGSHSVETLKCFSDLTGINADKLFALHADECVLNIRGLPPFFGRKSDPEKHINYGKIEKE